MRLLGANVLANCDAATLEAKLREEARRLSVQLVFFQSNSEGALLDFLDERHAEFDRVLLFPTTLAQTGLALRQHMRLLSLPAIEVHFDPEQAAASILRPLCFEQFQGLKGALEGLRMLTFVQRDAPLKASTSVGVSTPMPAKTFGRKKPVATSSAKAAGPAAGVSGVPVKTIGRKR
jgi:hypothetical protein